MAVRVVSDLVTIRHDLLGKLRVVVDPMARKEERDVQPAIAQQLQDSRRGATAFGPGVEGERDDARGWVTVHDLGVILRIVLRRDRATKRQQRKQRTDNPEWPQA